MPTSPRKKRKQLESELLRKMQQAQVEWREAKGADRIAARAHFVEILNIFWRVAIEGKDPAEEYGETPSAT